MNGNKVIMLGNFERFHDRAKTVFLMYLHIDVKNEFKEKEFMIYKE